MSNPGFSFKFMTRTRDEVGRSPSRSGSGRHIVLEPLEGRQLLSGVHASSLRSTTIAQVDHLPQHPHAGPVHDNFGTGYAVKSPRFYEEYNGSGGQFRAPINAAGMKATYLSTGDLVLTGIVAGSIDPQPKDASGSEYYVFGINHNGASTVAPFPGRPNIKYDAFVAVAFTPSGSSAFVYDMATGTTTQLAPDAVLFSATPSKANPGLSPAYDFKVYVPAGTPGTSPSAGGGVNPSVVFWTSNTAMTTSSPDPTTVASFAPEGRTIPIAGGAGINPPRHLA